MTNAPAQVFTDHMQVLFGVGTCAGMTDGQLLERFMAGRDESGDLAFETLVTRHGPMVMRVCRNVLDDPQDVHDAFQAVFVVLARRANAIRDRHSVGSWLYGVAVRVTARARVTAIRRQIRDRRTMGAAQAIATVDPNEDGASPTDRDDRAEVVHQELSRLPEKYRAPVVLCYFEGLTHDEAAARLSWPVGTVRSRLARARDRLRNRLTHRGVSAPASIGPMANWLVGQPVASTKLIATVSAASSAPISRELLTSIARAVGKTTGATPIPSASLLLAQGVLNTMLLKKLLMIACACLPLGTIVIGGGALLVRKSQAQDQRTLVKAALQDAPAATKPSAPKPPEVDPLLQQSIAAAANRMDAQRAYFEEGRITLDRYIDACRELEMAQLMAAQTAAERTTIKQSHIERLMKIEKRETVDLDAGRGTIADLSEIAQRRVQAEAALKSEQDLPSILRRLGELERQVKQLQKERAEK
jgi:RNA polymerase sigma factor (sigma-70 family)